MSIENPQEGGWELLREGLFIPFSDQESRPRCIFQLHDGSKLEVELEHGYQGGHDKRRGAVYFRTDEDSVFVDTNGRAKVTVNGQRAQDDKPWRLEDGMTADILRLLSTNRFFQSQTAVAHTYTREHFETTRTAITATNEHADRVAAGRSWRAPKTLREAKVGEDFVI